MVLDTGRAVTEERRLVDPGPRGVLWDAQGEMHLTQHLRIPAAPMEQATSGGTASSPREGHLISGIREGMARNVIGLKQARQGLGRAGWLVPQPEGPAAGQLLENARYF